MIVSDAIKELLKMPQDAELSQLWDGELRTDVNIIYLARNGKVVTSDYNQVCYSEEARPTESPTVKQEPYWSTPNK